MPEMTSYPPGVPCWVDLTTAEPDAALQFYGRLFEWDAVDLGEETGHRHAIKERVTLFRDEALATDIPGGLYIGHVKVASDYARVTHDEHAPVTWPRGTYRGRRQRELGPLDARGLAD